MADATQTAAQAATAALRSLESSTTQETGSTGWTEAIREDNRRKRHFLDVFRRWEALFKRKDRGDEEAERWLVAEYYRSLMHLSPAGLEALTEQLKASATFFPSIRECLDLCKPKPFAWGNPIALRKPEMFVPAETLALLADARRYAPALTDQREDSGE